MGDRTKKGVCAERDVPAPSGDGPPSCDGQREISLTQPRFTRLAADAYPVRSGISGGVGVDCVARARGWRDGSGSDDFRLDGGFRGDGRFNGDDQRGDTINGSFGAANSVTNNGRFWQVGSTTSFGANTNFEGIGLSGNSFSVRAGTTINDGRILTGTGQAITLAGNSINFKGRTWVQRRSGVARRREFERGDSDAFALCVEDGRGGIRGGGIPPPVAACGRPPVNDGAAPMLRERAGDADGRRWRRRRRNLADRCAQ